MNYKLLDDFAGNINELLDKESTKLKVMYLNKSPSDIGFLFGIESTNIVSNTNSMSERVARDIKKQFLCQVACDSSSTHNLNYSKIFQLARKSLFEEYYTFDKIVGGNTLKLYNLMLDLIRSNKRELCIASNLSAADLQIALQNLTGVYKTADNKYFQIYDDQVVEIFLKDPLQVITEFNQIPGNAQCDDRIEAMFDGYLKRNELIFTEDISIWKKSVDYIFAIFNLEPQNINPNWKIKKLVNSIKYFEKHNFSFDVLYGDLNLIGVNTKQSINKIENHIDNMVSQYGIYFYQFILNKLSNFSKFDRVFFDKYLGQDINEDIEPLGYALKYAVKHVRKRVNIKYDDNKLQSILNYISCYVALYQLHDFSRFDSMFSSPHTHPNYILEIKRNIQFDQIYRCLQLPSRYANKIITIFDNFKIKNEGFNQQLQFIRFLYTKYYLHQPYELKIPSFKSQFKDPKKIIDIISNMKIKNTHLALLNNVTQDVELVGMYGIIQQVGLRYIFNNHPCLNLLMIEYVKNCAYKYFKMEYQSKDPEKRIEDVEKEAADVFGVILGNSFEGLVTQELQLKNIVFLANKWYHPSQNVAMLELGIINECDVDFIIESNTVILIIEAKAKQLTIDAKFGNDCSIVYDLMGGFIDSQYQAKRLEFILKKQGSVMFKDGSKLELNARKIITVSLSLSETYDSLMDKHFARDLFDYFSMRKFFINDDSSGFKEQNKKLKELRNIISGKEIKLISQTNYDCQPKNQKLENEIFYDENQTKYYLHKNGIIDELYFKPHVTDKNKTDLLNDIRDNNHYCIEYIRLVSLFENYTQVCNDNTHNIYFLSFQQLITLLEDSNNNEDFISRLSFGSGMLNGHKDAYIDFAWTNKMMEVNPSCVFP